MTPEGFAALKAELARLRAERAALAGDDEATRARIADLDRRVERVDATLATLTVLGPPDGAADGPAAFGAWVTVEDEAGARRTWRLVGPDEADPRRGLVNVHSPLGAALLGRAVGDVAEVDRPGGAAELTVVAVSRTAPGGS